MPHTAEPGSSHTRQVGYFKGRTSALPSHCILVAGLSSRWETWAWSPCPLEEAQNCHLTLKTRACKPARRVILKELHSSPTWITLPANAECEKLEVEGSTALPRGRGATGSFRPRFYWHKLRLCITWIRSQHHLEKHWLLLAKIVAGSVLTCPGKPMMVYLTRRDTALLSLPYKAGFLTYLKAKFYFLLINNVFIFVKYLRKINDIVYKKSLHWITLNGHYGPLWFLKKGRPWFFFFPLRFHIFRTTVTQSLELSLHFSFDQWQQPTISIMHSTEQTRHGHLA